MATKSAIRFAPSIRSSASVSLQLSACIRAAHQLRDVCTATGHVDLNEPQRMAKVWEAAHAAQTRRWAEDAFSSFHARVEGKPNLPLAKKSVFNHESTPYLEKYFESNAYPSAADRANLADKTTMTPRQIEVWFQNHRSRAKRDGKPLHKSTDNHASLNEPLQPDTPQKQKFFVQHRCLENFQQDSLPMLARPERLTENSPLNPPRPSHAFPTVYHAHPNKEPFSTKVAQFEFPVPVWYRKPATPLDVSPSSVNFDDFVADFTSRLHLGHPAKKQRSKTVKPWFAATVTSPQPAPLPALIRPTHSHVSKADATQMFPRLFHTAPSLGPSIQTSILLSRSSRNSPIRRKAAQLPKRTPKYPSVSHYRNDKSADDSCQLSASSACTTSYSSDVSSARTPSSSSSDSSSSGPPTPVLVHSTLSDLSSSVTIHSDSNGAPSSDLYPPVPESFFDLLPAVAPKRLVVGGFESSSTSRRQIRSLPRRSFASS